MIFGANGVNTNVITRAVSFPTVNTSTYEDADPLVAGNNLIYGDVPNATTTDRFGDYNNLIFGAFGVVAQDTQEATVGVIPNTMRTVTGTLAGHAPTGGALNGVATLTCTAACFQASDVGLMVSDGALLSAGTIITAVSGDLKTATLSRDPVGRLGFTLAGTTMTIGPRAGLLPPDRHHLAQPVLRAERPHAVGRRAPREDPDDPRHRRRGIRQRQHHGDNRIYGSGGDSIIIGGDGSNNIQGGPGRNLIIGGSAVLSRSAHLFNYTNARFQDLTGTQIYSTTPGLADEQPDQRRRPERPHRARVVGRLPLRASAASCSRSRSASTDACDVPAGLRVQGRRLHRGRLGLGHDLRRVEQQHHPGARLDRHHRTASATGYPTTSNGSPSIGSVFGGAATCSFRGSYLGNRVGACRDSGTTC